MRAVKATSANRSALTIFCICDLLLHACTGWCSRASRPPSASSAMSLRSRRSGRSTSACLPNWIIAGGESGPHARVMRPAWARHIRDQCRALGIAFFHKQWGTYRSNPLVQEDSLLLAEAERRGPRANGKDGALLDGRLHREFPGEQLAVVSARASVSLPRSFARELGVTLARLRRRADGGEVRDQVVRQCGNLRLRSKRRD